MPTLVLDPPPAELQALIERREKLGQDLFDEVLIVDPQEQAVRWLRLARSEYGPLERSALIDLGPGELADQIDWP